MPSTQSYKEYAMMRGQTVDWNTFAAENNWAKVHKYSELPIPEKSLAIYYIVNKEDQSIIDRVAVTSYDKQYKNEFKELNLKWVSKFFEVEANDVYQLENPEDAILKDGGEVFFLLSSDNVVAGVVADVIHDGNCELAKMTVRDEFTGKGYANILMREAIQWAKDRKYPYIDLYSSVKLENAIALYKKFGFATTHLGPHPAYKRCSIIMKLTLDQ